MFVETYCCRHACQDDHAAFAIICDIRYFIILISFRVTVSSSEEHYAQMTTDNFLLFSADIQLLQAMQKEEGNIDRLIIDMLTLQEVK